MIPYMYFREQLMVERVRERQHEAEQEQMLAGLQKPSHGIMRYLIGCLGIFFRAPGTGMQQLEQPAGQAVCNYMGERTPYRKDTIMNPQLHAEEQLNRATHLEAVVPERERLVKRSFTAEEIVALLRLRQWYQMGGSDRIPIVRHWEFLKLLVRNGKLEV